ncbi:hypothetical protein WR25_19118 [Diploscapter pachys]|uniref:Dynein light intermediate chain n=1 Tax=Diploscapter pachys TaxID=2018661 RepID=A0A2A2L2T4_9BILA|nr:hypothetical protein WR25_19118 [Diploscapter pachys]
MVGLEPGVGTTLPSAVPLIPSANQDDERIWTKILQEVSSKSSNTVQSAVIVLGDNGSGKTSLLNKLEVADKESLDSALEYRVLKVQNEFAGAYAYQLGTAAAQLGPAESIYLPVWCLDGSEKFAPLLQHTLPPTSPGRIVCVLVGSLDNPNLIHSLRKWATLFNEQISKKYEKTTINEAKKLQERFWQEYVEPVESSMTASIAVGNLDDEAGLLPLEQGVLTENLGTSFIIAITKSDLSHDMSDQQADRILVQVRRFCLLLGAALIYTSSKSTKNIQLIHKYVVHRAYNMPFTTPAQLIDRDGLFVPAGWDGQKKIDIIKEGIPDVDGVLEPTREVIPQGKDPIVEAEEDQIFLQRLMAASEAAAAAQQSTTPKKPIDEAADTSSPLANFFSQLLKDKPSPGQKSATAAPPEDAKDQLDRILKSTGAGAGGTANASAAGSQSNTDSEVNQSADESAA